MSRQDNERDENDDKIFTYHNILALQIIFTCKYHYCAYTIQVTLVYSDALTPSLTVCPLFARSLIRSSLFFLFIVVVVIAVPLYCIYTVHAVVMCCC